MTGILEANIHFSLTEPLTVLKVSSSIKALLGFDADDFLSKKVSFLSRIHKGDQDIVDKLFTSNIDRALSSTFNIRIRHADKRIRCIKGTYSKTNGILELLLQDAKSLARENKGLIPTSSSFNAIMENTGDYVYFKDRNHVFTGASQTLTTVTSFHFTHSKDIVGLTDYDIFTEEYADEYYLLEKQVFSGTPVAQQVQRTLDTTGNKGWIDNRQYPLQDNNGQLTGLFGIARNITQQKKIEESLQLSESRLETVLGLSKIGYWELYSDQRTAFWSDEVYQLFGFEKNVKPGPQSLCAVVDKRDFPIFAKSIKSSFLNGQEHQVEYRIKRPSDGKERWIDCRGKIITGEDGKPEKISGFIQDITERKTDELNTLKNEEMYRHLFEMSEDPMWMILDNKFVLANQSAAKALGYDTIEEVINTSPSQISPKFQADGHPSNEKSLEMISIAFKNSYHRFDWTHIDRNGRHFPVEVSLTRIPFSGQDALFCIWRDISVRKTAEEMLKKSEERWHFALEGNGEGVWDWDLTTDHVFFSKQHSAMRGYQESEITNDLDNWKKCIHPDDMERVYCALDKHFEQKSASYECEYRLLCKDGSYKWILDRGKVVEWSNDQKALRMIGTHLDVTPRKEAEKKLQLSSRVFTHTYEGIVITDTNRKVIDANPAFFKITGYNRKEIIGQNPSILRSDRQDTQFYQSMWQEINENDYWQGEVWNRKKGGEFYAQLLTISVLKNDIGDITNYLGVFTDITQTKLQQEKLDLMAYYDVLTKLPNRALFIDRFNQAIAHSKRSNSQLAICYIDLDKFKPINDNYGHAVGDLVLIDVAKRITDCIREEDTVSRQGGDEFALLISNVESQAHCEKTLERIHHALAQPFIIDSISHDISASSGYTIYPNDTGDIDTLLRHADHAMYGAKQAGRNRYHLFNPEQDKETAHKRHRLGEIEQALVNEDFCLYYQPKVNMVTGEVFGVEALIRWDHPESGLIPPLDFLPYIDGTDLEIRIGSWVINEAVAQLVLWQQVGIELELSINVSSYHLLSEGFYHQLQDTLKKHPSVDSKFLQIEILETSVLRDIEDISNVMKACQEGLGIRFALDDFGTGYSSLAHLKNLSANTIKIDQTFIRDILEDPSDYVIIAGIIGLANSFNLNVIAEGVETTEHGLLLLTMGCEDAQGYGIAKPMPASEIPHWLAEYTINKDWLASGHKRRTHKENKLESFRLTNQQWQNHFVSNIQSSPGTIEYWPIIDGKTCHCSHWIKRAKQEKLIETEYLDDLQESHKKIHLLAHDLFLKYQNGNIETAREGLPELQGAFDKMNEVLGVV